DAPVLRREAETEARDLVRLEAGDVAAEEAHRAGAPRDQTHDRLQGGRLARARAPPEGDHPAPAPLHGKGLEDLRGAVPRAQALDGEHRVARHGAGPTARPTRLPLPK